MPIIAIYAIIAITIFGVGFTTAYKLEHSQINTLELQIKVSNEEARHLLVDATEKVEAAEKVALVTNANLETEHDKNIKLNDDVSSALANVRMRVTTKRANCNSAMPSGSGSRVVIDSTDTTELPDDFKRLLRSETLRADNLAVYANEAYQFVKSNCGIKQ
jgi:hypothetical protein